MSESEQRSTAGMEEARSSGSEAVIASASFAPSAAAIDDKTDRPNVGPRYVTFLLLAVAGVNIALVAPIGLSLALRVQALAPDNVEFLGFIIAIASTVGLFANALVGMWSDRTRTRWGSRRPFAFAGAVAGLVGVLVMATAGDLIVLTVGWIVTSIGFGVTMNALLMSQADRLAPDQRGRIAGLSGVLAMVSAVIGVSIASTLVASSFLVFLIPGALGFLAALLWVVFVKEASSVDAPERPRLGIRGVLRGLVFDPRMYPNFAWNWLGRLCFYIAIQFATTFTTLFFASRLTTSGQIADLGPFIAILSLIGAVATSFGAFGSGYFSDKLKRRRVFVLGAAIIFTTGALTMALGGSNTALLIAGTVVMNMGLGIFVAVDQAIVLDIIPDGDAGRFLGINGYSSSLAQGVAPALAVPLLLIGVSGPEKNYALLLVIAAVCSLAAGIIVTTKVRGTS
ncbi:MFS transporter [Herbiconiux sp. 11R-BC]|uniref:MFS transporter n=1 Tax=Herbiconiux sp. 11R-BC TaxID=3111637 RepID=UPI003C0828E2